MIITICASIDFSPKIIEVKKALEDLGHQVNIPYFTEKIINSVILYEDFIAEKEENGDILLRQGAKIDMIKRYWEFIKNSDGILVLNINKKGTESYIGGSTLMEMGFAYGHNKKIFLFNKIPSKSERIHYVDEIIDMKPCVINQDLSQIKL